MRAKIAIRGLIVSLPIVFIIWIAVLFWALIQVSQATVDAVGHLS